MLQDNTAYFEIERKNGPYNMHSAHFHNYHELYFLLKGRTKYFINGEIFTLSAGDIIFVPKGEFHQTDYQDTNNAERIIFNFNEAFLYDEYIPIINNLSEIKHFSIPKAYINILSSLISKLEAERRSMSHGCVQMEKLYMCQLLVLVTRHMQSPRNTTLNEAYQIAQDAAKFINTNFNLSLTVADIARKYSISPDYFSKIFKKSTGVNFSEYLTVTRITAAQVLLSTTNKTATQVAMECGFNDSNYFIQVFKKIHGITPKKYSMQFRR